MPDSREMTEKGDWQKKPVPQVANVGEDNDVEELEIKLSIAGRREVQKKADCRPSTLKGRDNGMASQKKRKEREIKKKLKKEEQRSVYNN